MGKHTTQLSLFTTAPGNPHQEIPYGYCKCGCGQKTKISPQSSTFHGHINGIPRDYLAGHYFKRHADLTLADIFWRFCSQGMPDECWIWQGYIGVNGYGGFRFRNIQYAAHRVSYELHIGRIPSNLEVCHNCPTGDNRACVNPAHFFLGTQSENMHDMYNKGRQARGESKANAKLTEEKVREIRFLHGQSLSQTAIAQQLGVSRGIVGYVLRGETWKHVI